MKSYFNVAVLSVVFLISSHIATAFEMQYPKIRFTPYDDLTVDQQAAASGLGYTEETWNKPGSYALDKVTWWYLINRDYYDLDEDGDWKQPNELFNEYASALGFPDKNGENDEWDCWSAHYDYDEWDEIVEYKLDEAFGVLGWNEALWSSDPPEAPDSSAKDYEELSDAEKTAAGVICYTKSLWDGDVLSSFALDSPRAILVGKKKKKKSRMCNWASGDLSRCNFMNKGVAKHCCNTCGTCEQHKCVNTKAKFFWTTRKRDNKKLYKKCGFLKGKNKAKNCRRWGMKETCPLKCNAAACIPSN